MNWKLNIKKNIKSKNSVIIEGLPGIGSVGKIAVDFMIDDLKAEKIMDLQGSGLPGCVFINENNLVELPKIEIFYKRLKNKGLFLISGDAQPVDEVSSYEFCESILDIYKKYDGSEIITLGGIGLQESPRMPSVYCTGNSKKAIQKYNSYVKSMYGMVGPIVGVSGLLVGLAGKKNIPAVSLLAETYASPTHVGLKGAKELLKVIDKSLNLNLDFKRLDKEVKELEKELKTVEEIPVVKKREEEKDTSYIS